MVLLKNVYEGLAEGIKLLSPIRYDMASLKKVQHGLVEEGMKRLC